MLDTQLGSFTDLVLRREGIRLNDISGGGAAGGAGAGVSLFANAKLKSGIDTVLDMVGFEEKARNKQLIITGEGRTDSQGLDGKAVIGIARRAKKLGVPVAVIAGDLDDDISRLYDEGVAFVLSTNRVAKDFTKIRHRSKTYLKLCADTLMRIINTVKNSKP
jgi:glycerate kinase